MKTPLLNDKSSQPTPDRIRLPSWWPGRARPRNESELVDLHHDRALRRNNHRARLRRVARGVDSPGHRHLPGGDVPQGRGRGAPDRRGAAQDQVGRSLPRTTTKSTSSTSNRFLCSTPTRTHTGSSRFRGHPGTLAQASAQPRPASRRGVIATPFAQLLASADFRNLVPATPGAGAKARRSKAFAAYA